MRGLALEKKKGEGVVLETGKWGNAVGDRELDASMQWQLRCGFMQRGDVLVCFEILCSFVLKQILEVCLGSGIWWWCMHRTKGLLSCLLRTDLSREEQLGSLQPTVQPSYFKVQSKVLRHFETQLQAIATHIFL